MNLANSTGSSAPRTSASKVPSLKIVEGAVIVGVGFVGVVVVALADFVVDEAGTFPIEGFPTGIPPLSMDCNDNGTPKIEWGKAKAAAAADNSANLKSTTESAKMHDNYDSYDNFG